MKSSYPSSATLNKSVSDYTPNIDFRSDTVTKPCQKMRQVMSEAIVGDDVYGEDPTINQLQNKVAQLLNKEAGLFVPSGTMSNLLALMSHCQRGDEAIVGDEYHIFSHEAGGASALGSVVMQSIRTTTKGYISADQVKRAIRPDDSHFAQTRLICLENTVSGFVQKQTELEAIAQLAKEQDLSIHLDGARLMHAVIKSGNSAAQLAQPFDSVSLCLSKGLGAPAGSVLCGSNELINTAKRWRKMLGGGMRQAGVLAAAGIYAIDNNIQRLQQDHDLAKYFAQQLNLIDQVNIDVDNVETNMLFVQFKDANSTDNRPSISKYLIESGICITQGELSRIVVHLDISRADVDYTLEKIRAYYCQ